MKTFAVINQNTYTEYRNEEQLSRVHDYELKFEGEDYSDKFQKWLEDQGGKEEKEWNGKNIGVLPEKYHCWCSCYTTFLIEHEFEFQSATNKSHFFIK